MKNNLLALSQKLLVAGLALFLLVSLPGCDLLSTSEDPGKGETQVAISIQQTTVAGKLGQLSAEDLQSTQDAQAALGGQDSGNEPTHQVEDPATEPVPPSELPPTEPATPTDTPKPSIDFDSWIKSANILLYEDMVNHIIDTNRYVRDTLDEMGLPYKDDGSAKGWLKTDLQDGAPDGQPWDLVIIAAESKKGLQGEFFEYVLEALDNGSSVILEVWYLDQTYLGSAGALLKRCGVEFQSNWVRVPPAGMVMFPVNSSHSLLSDPHRLSFTNVTSYWWDDSGKVDYDIGDLVKTSGGDAQILVASNPSSSNSHGTLTVCIDERLILQTFSSHQLAFKNMAMAWENYILHGLKKRFEEIQ